MNDSLFSLASDESRAVASYCAVCESSEGPFEVQEIVGKKGTSLTHVTCGRCHGMALLLQEAQGVAVNAVGMAVDLTPEDVIHASSLGALTPDHAIEFHARLGEPAFLEAFQPAKTSRVRAKNTAKPKKAR